MPNLIALDASLVSGEFTGDSTYWTGLVAAWAENPPEGLDFAFFAPHACPKGLPAWVRERWNKQPSKSRRLWSLVKFPLAARRLGAALHTQYSLSPLSPPNAITTIHDVSMFIGPQWFQVRDRILLQRSLPLAAKRAKAIITVSQNSVAEVERFLPAAKGKTYGIHNGSNPHIHPIPQATANQMVKSKFGLREPFVLTVGTRWPRKNLQLAVDAMDLLPDHVPHRLLITGKAGWGELAHSPRVRTTGYVNTELLSALYSSADLYLCPSFHEGFGIPLLEAFETGCPVLSSSGGALPEVAGNAAEIAPDFEPETWAKLIQSLLGDSGKLATYRERGFLRAKDFSWARSAAEHCAVYKSVLA